MSCSTGLQVLGSHPQNNQYISRKDAEERLRDLALGSEEYRLLESALKIKNSGIVEINLPTGSYKVETFHQHELLMGGFGSSEHMEIGKKITLKGLTPGMPLLIRGSVRIYFHHIVALAGDFYGVVDGAISLLGGTEEEKTERFNAAFETLASANSDQVRRIIQEIEGEHHVVKNSGLPHHCYSADLMEKNAAIKRVKSDIDKLLVDNSDHFSVNAKEAYEIGHKEALKLAKEAGSEQDIEKLRRAYALDAYACHFLTDLFAAGHIRNQRGALETFLLSIDAPLAKALSGLLTAAQHEKDGNEGLNVYNGRGEYWRAYGDGCFFSPKNAENVEKVVAATQRSVDEIYHFFNNPELELESLMDQFIPKATDFNPLPLYFFEGTSLFLTQSKGNERIDSVHDYLLKAIPLALRYLPDSYVSGFFASLVSSALPDTPQIINDAKVVLNKTVVVLAERITGSVWHTVGVATYYQAKQQEEKTNEKIDELAGIARATYENSELILGKLNEMDRKLVELKLDNEFKRTRKAIFNIGKRANEYKSFQLDTKQLQDSATEIWNAFITLFHVFLEGNMNGRNMLDLYRSSILDDPILTDVEKKILVTQWFRNILDYQAEAIRLYILLNTMGGALSGDDMRSKTIELEAAIVKQIEANLDFIDAKLISESKGYIALQLEKQRKLQCFQQLIDD